MQVYKIVMQSQQSTYSEGMQERLELLGTGLKGCIVIAFSFLLQNFRWSVMCEVMKTLQSLDKVRTLKGCKESWKYWVP